MVLELVLRLNDDEREALVDALDAYLNGKSFEVNGEEDAAIEDLLVGILDRL